jgi:hypothetical protein
MNTRARQRRNKIVDDVYECLLRHARKIMHLPREHRNMSLWTSPYDHGCQRVPESVRREAFDRLVGDGVLGVPVADLNGHEWHVVEPLVLNHLW